MMRWVLLTLLILNGAYFLWQRHATDLPGSGAHRVAVTGAELRLASEVPQALHGTEAAPGQEDEREPPAPKIEAQRSTAAEKESEPAQPAMPAPESVESQSEAAATEAIAQAAQPELRACYTIGPFLLVNDVSKTAEMFEGAEGMAAQQRAAADRSQVGFWVYVPSAESLQAARAVLRDLQSKDIREVLIISEGVKANSISAGVYSVEAQAQQRRDTIRALGYQAEIDPLYRTQAQYWLDVELTTSKTIPAKLWKRVVNSFPNITRTERPCE